MGSIAIACFKPRPGCEQPLLELVRNHLPPLRAEGLVTERASREAIESAHKNPAVLALWKKFEAACWYETPANLPEFQNMFSHFEPVP
jgi:hypothetical protein